jgi:hypothetical protein
VTTLRKDEHAAALLASSAPQHLFVLAIAFRSVEYVHPGIYSRTQNPIHVLIGSFFVPDLITAETKNAHA